MRQYIHINRRLLNVSGEDTQSFLQGLVTVDVLKLSPEMPRYGALLTPQGKFLYDFFLLANGDAVWLDADAACAADLQARLTHYRLRAKVDIKPAENIHVFALPEKPLSLPPEGCRLIADPRYAPLGWRLYGSLGPCAVWLQAEGYVAADLPVYEAHRLRFGIPDGARDLIAARSFIVECGFEQLHAVDFDKGCYVGQELTARTKYRANLRKQFYLVRGSGALPPPGTAVMSGEKEAGELRSSQGDTGLAMLYTEVVQQGENLRADNVFLRAAVPPWLEEKSSGGECASGV